MTDKQLYKQHEIAARIKNDSLTALKELYELYQKRIYYFVLKHLKSEEEAREHVQNAFLLLWEHRKNIDEHQSIKSYLYKIVSNQIYNTLHKRATIARYKKYAADKYPIHLDDTQQHIFYEDIKNIIYKLIDKLPEQRKQIFILSREQGLTHDEIAKKMNISKRTVENNIYKALKFLKNHLGGEIF